MMKFYDVFNGDADGICALQQLRLEETTGSTLITGVKRDIKLLEGVSANAGDTVTALDISLDANRGAVTRLLTEGARIIYFDHHFAGTIPPHENLQATIDPAPHTCTSLLVDQYLGGKHRSWAIVGAFGDNLDASAERAAQTLGLDKHALYSLRELGIYLNYNAYGATIDDLYFAPDELFRRLHPFTDPREFIYEDDAFERLRAGYAEDLARADSLAPYSARDKSAVYVLPSEPWARRVSGVFANQLAQDVPTRAHALLTGLPEGGFVVSVRAPLKAPRAADDLCRRFPTGGGRQAAAGINHLPEARLEDFINQFVEHYG
jgi:single-stranded DNA-specific DHH superfamily exonuclease